MKNFANSTRGAAAALGIAAVLSSCTNEPYGNTTRGTIGGAAGGAAAGAIIGNNVSGVSAGEGAIAGALVGGVLGNVMGRQQDQINAARIEANQDIVNVPNSNGSYTPVVLTRVPGGWRGPRGEFYTSMPSPRQLSQTYGF